LQVIQHQQDSQLVSESFESYYEEDIIDSYAKQQIQNQEAPLEALVE
jgi:hypothetical protein